MTDPSTARSVRKIRHSIRKRAYVIYQLTAGQPGASKEMQVGVLDKQIELLEAALKLAKEAREIVATRDFEAYKTAKDAQAAAPAPEKLVDSEEKAVQDLTFEQIVAKLNGEATEVAGEDPEVQPPF